MLLSCCALSKAFQKLFCGIGDYKTGRTQIIVASFPWAGSAEHTLAGSGVRQVSHSGFTEKRQLLKNCEENDLINKRTLRRLFAMLMVLVMGLLLLTGCSTKSTEQAREQEDAQTIQVYLWTNNLYETYAPYIQS